MHSKNLSRAAVRSLFICMQAVGLLVKGLASEPEGPDSNPEPTEFLSNSSEQAADALVSLFTKQYKLGPAS